MLTIRQKEFMKVLGAVDHSRSSRDVFVDFLEVAYCALAQRGFAASVTPSVLEERYLNVMRSYKRREDRDSLCRLLALTTLAGENQEGDFLGPIAADDAVRALDARQGQFFTPQAICHLMSLMTLPEEIPEKGYIVVREPACGSGALILSAADGWHSKGHEVCSTILFDATDISDVAYKMTFVQLTLYGVAARVSRGNTLSGETFEWAFTVSCHVFYEEHGEILGYGKQRPRPQRRSLR